jgi:hypothetical protein
MVAGDNRLLEDGILIQLPWELFSFFLSWHLCEMASNRAVLVGKLSVQRQQNIWRQPFYHVNKFINVILVSTYLILTTEIHFYLSLYPLSTPSLPPYLPSSCLYSLHGVHFWSTTALLQPCPQVLCRRMLFFRCECNFSSFKPGASPIQAMQLRKRATPPVTSRKPKKKKETQRTALVGVEGFHLSIELVDNKPKCRQGHRMTTSTTCASAYRAGFVCNQCNQVCCVETLYSILKLWSLEKKKVYKTIYYYEKST